MSWVFGPGGTTATPGGANGDIQFNSTGSFSGSALLTTDGAGSLSASVNISASAFYGDGSNLTGLTASAVNVADGPEYSIQFRRDAPVTGEISGSVNLRTNAALDHVFLTGTLYVQGQNAYFGNGSGGGFLRVNGDSDTHIQFGPAGSDSMDFVAGGKRLIRLDENGADVVALGSAATDTIYISGSLTASVGMRVSASAANGEDIFVGSGNTRTIGVLQGGGDDFFVIGQDNGKITLSSSSGIEFVTDTSEGVGSFGSPIKVFDDQNGTNTVVSLTTAGVVSGSGQLRGASVAVDGIVTAHRVQIDDGSQLGTDSDTDMLTLTNGDNITVASDLELRVGNLTQNRVATVGANSKLTDHSNFTFASNVLSVPTITASVGVMVTSSANGSINIGEGIKYTFNGDDRLDVYQNEFRLKKTNLYQGVFSEQTSNFDISDSQIFLVDTNSSVVTGTLPGVTSTDDFGVTYIIKDSGGYANTNNVVIEPSGSQKIDGGTSAKIQTNYGAMTVVGISSSVNGFGWAIVSAT